jgi:SHS2 domain-containing protein
MAYKFVEDTTVSDVAFEAEAPTVQELFASCGAALINTMIKNLADIKPRIKRVFSIETEDIEKLLFDFLEKLVFYKDTEQLVFNRFESDIRESSGNWNGIFSVYGDKLDPKRHEFLVDVKAVTMHMFEIEKTDKGWFARAVLDI